MRTLQHIQHQISAINDLIKINYDRETGYEKVFDGNEEAELRVLFKQYIAQSKKNISELNDLILILGGQPAVGTTPSGKFYHTWLDIKSTILGRDWKSILSDCEYGEEVACKAYREAIDDKELIWEDKNVLAIVKAHLKGLTTAYDKIKELKDAMLLRH